MRSSSILGLVLILIGLLLVYVLRGLLVQVIVLMLGVGGLILGFILIVIGLALIFGRRAILRGFTWRLSANPPEI
jgi:hypothetical protein